jgi:hypothetical protein
MPRHRWTSLWPSAPPPLSRTSPCLRHNHIRNVLPTQSAHMLEEGAACVCVPHRCAMAASSLFLPHHRGLSPLSRPAYIVGLLLNLVVLGILAPHRQSSLASSLRTTRAPSTSAALPLSPASPSSDLTPPDSRLLRHARNLPCFISISLPHSSQSVLWYM